MYNNFTEYWEIKKGMYEKLFVTKEVAHNIWLDACNLIEKKIYEEAFKK